jgi:hypothetical protein
VAFGIAGIVLAWLAMNLLYAANERESVDHPPNYPELYAGVALALVAPPLSALALRRPGASRVLGWIGLGVEALAAVWAVGILLQPPL